VGFLAPAFLLGALAVGLPLYLHLLRRSTSTQQPFSSLMFFELRQPSSTQRRRLRYWLLLTLRIVLVLLMALTFANPYINRLIAAGSADKLTLIVVDNSFSMRAGTRLADAKSQALALLSARARTQIVELGSQARLLTQPTQDTRILRAAIEGIQPGDSRGSFAVLATAVRSIVDSEHTPVDVHLFSDLQKTNMPPNFAEMALPRGATLVLHPISNTAAPNWAVESVNVAPLVWDPHTTHVQAVVAGYGTAPVNRTVSFTVDGKTLATRQVEIPASGRVTAEIDSLELPYGFSRGSVKIDAADSLAADDEYVFAIERADRKRGLLVYQPSDTQSPLFFGDAVTAAAQSAVLLDRLPVDRAASVDPSTYAFVVISDVVALPSAFASKILDYVNRGGNVLMAVGTAASQQRELPIFGGSIIGTRHYAREAEHYAAVSAEEWEGVRFYYATAVDEKGAKVTLRLQDGTPLLLEKQVGAGRVMVFASGFDNLTNDLPLHPVFVALVDGMVRHLSGNDERSGPHLVDDMIAVQSGTQQLSRRGFYEAHLANGRQELVAINVDRRESDLAPIPADVLALWRGSGVSEVFAPTKGVQVTTVPHSVWWYAMFGVLVAALLESFVGGRYLATLRDEP
jgi:hypothetical protein